MHRDLLNYAIANIRTERLRSWLTILSIIIGICAITLLVSLSLGLDAAIKSQLAFFGQDIITVSPGSMEQTEDVFSGSFAMVGRLTEEDAKALEKISGVKEVVMELEGLGSLKFRGEEASAFVIGADTSMLELYDMQLESGRYHQSGEKGAVILGYKVAHDYFDQEVGVGQRLNISNKTFAVIGVLEKSGNPLMSSMDSAVFISVPDGREIISQYKDNKDLAGIFIQVDTERAQVSDVKEEVEDTLRRMHKVPRDEEDFTVITSDYIMSILGAVFGMLTLFLGGVASISLLVGGIGIANTMFMAVMERTQEIGTLKALGADETAILEIFLIESGVIGLIGGIIGVVISYALTFLITLLSGFSCIVPWWLALFAIFFSFLMGAVSGYLPARRAAKLNPVEALRYE